MPDERVNPFQSLELNLSAGTPIEAIMEAAAAILRPIGAALQTKRETMSQSNRDNFDLLEYAIHESLCLRLGLVTVEQLQRLRFPVDPPGVTGPPMAMEKLIFPRNT